MKALFYISLQTERSVLPMLEINFLKKYFPDFSVLDADNFSDNYLFQIWIRILSQITDIQIVINVLDKETNLGSCRIFLEKLAAHQDKTKIYLIGNHLMTENFLNRFGEKLLRFADWESFKNKIG